MGEVIYIDRFGNLITNVEKDLFYQIKAERDFIIYLPRGKEVKVIARMVPIKRLLSIV